MNTTQPITLDVAKRDLEKSVKLVTRYMLQPVDSRLGSVRYIDREGTDKKAADIVHALYYFSSTVSNGHTFTKRVDAVIKQFPALKNDAQFMAMYDNALAAYLTAAQLAEIEKARKIKKARAVVLKKMEREELNLQEGVKLAGVDVGQYKVILAGLEPVRKFVESRRIETLLASFSEMVATVEKHVGNIRAAYPHPNYKGSSETPENFFSWFTKFSVSPESWVPKDQHVVRDNINAEAARFALAYVQGYAAKLAQKTGEVIANDATLAGYEVTTCVVSSNDLWHNSTALIQIASGSSFRKTLTFHTQIIWNRSCLGKVFNQYPTRRVL